jgi:DNA-binding response OmpR family regulator
MPKILIVDDEKDLVAGLAMNFKREGYEVLKAYDGDTALRLAAQDHPDLIILDVMMPGTDGLQVCRALRKNEADTRIIILSAKGDEIDKVVGLEIGADDYLSKPFSMRELLAIVRARLRYRTHGENSEHITEYAFGDVSIDFDKMTARRDGEDLELTPKEYDLLQYLISHRGQIVTRDRILDKLWGQDTHTTPRTVDNYILKLRKKVEMEPSNPRFIISVYGGGYKFVG